LEPFCAALRGNPPKLAWAGLQNKKNTGEKSPAKTEKFLVLTLADQKFFGPFKWSRVVAAISIA
jgi:hypothetical protein